MFIKTKYINIYILIGDDDHYEKMLTKRVEKKPLNEIYLIGYSYNIMAAHSLNNLNSNKKFK